MSRHLAKPVRTALLTLGLAACGNPDTERSPDIARPREEVGQRAAAIAGGAPVSFLRSVVQLNRAGSPFCSGTVVGPRHVLTARHCASHIPLNDVDASTPNPPSVPNITIMNVDPATSMRVTLGAVITSHWNFETDAALLVTDRDLGVEPLRVNSEPIGTSWIGRKVFAVGYGGGHSDANAWGAWLRIGRVTEWTYDAAGAGGETVCGGDSGGPDLAWLHGEWYVVGIHSTGPAECRIGAGSETALRADRVSSWMRSMTPARATVSARRTPGGPLRRDVMGNSLAENVVVTTATGLTVEGYSPGAGLRPIWTAPASLGFKTGRVETALADVDGNGRADLIALDRWGLRVYFSTGPATAPFDLANAVWVLSASNFNLRLGAVNLFVGDFDGDRKADLVVQEFSQAHLWKYNPLNRTFTDLGNILPGVTGLETTITVADFTGDAVSDLIVQDAGGATFVRGGPTLVPGARMPELPRGTALIPWRLGDPAVSVSAFGLIVMDTAGTRLWAPTPARAYPFQELAWRRTDLLANDTQVVIDDFNTDGRDDVLFVTASGTRLHRGTGNPAAPLTADVWVRTDLPILAVDYTSADYGGDGKGDLWITTRLGSAGYFGTNTAAAFTANQWLRPDLMLQRFLNR